MTFQGSLKVIGYTTWFDGEHNYTLRFYLETPRLTLTKILICLSHMYLTPVEHELSEFRKIRIMWLLDIERISSICLAVFTQCRSVTVRQTSEQTSCNITVSDMHIRGESKNN